ncbi:MAG TPA: cytochrome c oxidase assembly protein [Solirubrobacteraceae bacterium]|nr:cytochrome c oxidase assembly protein [Solirubrobacteraceae bacterium]
MNSAPGLGSWSFDPIAILALMAASYVYARMYRRARAATRPGSIGAGHWAPYAAGIATLAVALLSPLDAIGDRWLLSAHMAQHVLLSDVAPALIVLGLRAPVLPLGLSRPALRAVAPGGRFGRLLSQLTSPWVAIPLWATATWVWAIPAMFDFAAQHQLVHALEHATLFYTGLALWWLIVDPLPRARMRAGGERLALLGFTRIASAVICVPLTWVTAVQYPLYASAPRAYGLSALGDQQLAGAGMCFIEFLVFGIAFAAVFISMLGRDDARVSVAERAAAR